jgi:Xaa-Pro dipeptidase
MSIFSRSEIERRWSGLWQSVTDVDCVIACSFHNSYYLSGFPMHPWGRVAITVLFADGRPALIVPELELEAARSESPISDVRSYSDDDSPTAVASARLLIDLLRERCAGVVGVSSDEFPLSLEKRLREVLPAKVVDVGEQIDGLRLVSSEEELVLIRHAIRLTDLGMDRIVSMVKPGKGEAELTAATETAMMRAAPADTDTTTICVIQQGERQSTRCHRRSADIAIADRQTVQVWCEAYVSHYCGNVERCLILGAAPAAVRRACAVALEAYEAAAQLVRPGITFSQVHLAARGVLTRAGYSKIPTGSGLVRNILSGWNGRIESGNLRAHNQRELEVGMVLSVEPWAVIPGVGSPHLATTLLVTREGHEVLNQHPSTVPLVAQGQPSLSA